MIFDNFLFIFIEWSNNGCTTPDFRPGSCVDLRTCSSLLAVLNRNPLTNADRSYLLSHQCGRNGGVVFVSLARHIPLATQSSSSTCCSTVISRYAAHKQIHSQHSPQHRLNRPAVDSMHGICLSQACAVTS